MVEMSKEPVINFCRRSLWVGPYNFILAASKTSFSLPKYNAEVEVPFATYDMPCNKAIVCFMLKPNFWKTALEYI